MQFDIATARRVVFGPGVLAQLPDLARPFGLRILLVAGSQPGRAAPAIDRLRRDQFTIHTFSVPSEPTVDLVTAGAAEAREQNADLVIAIGGGSVLDAGKAIAALAANDQPVTEYLEVIGRAQPLPNPALPVIAIPTTAGTGSESTRNAVLASPTHRVKVSLRSPHMLPAIALVDPELAFDLPPALTASTGFDALTQLIEPYVCTRANPFTDALCRHAIPIAARALPRAVDHPRDVEARSAMALASLYSGMALANAGLGAVHGFAAPIGGMFNAPHGAVCAALLPHVTFANIQALRARQPDSPTLTRYTEVAQLLTGSSSAQPERAADFTRQLARRLGILPLRSFGITAADLPAIAEKAAQASSMKPNPIVLSHSELQSILAAAL